MRLLVSREQLYDAELLRVGLDMIQADDVFLCSYPKSGNTWVRFLIANLQQPQEEITFRNIDEYVPEIEWKPELNGRKARPIMKTHWPLYFRFPRFIYVYRDPRDALISYYHYCVNNGFFIGTLSEFIRSTLPDYYGNWEFHVEAAFEEFRKRPTEVCLLKYEELLERPIENVRRLSRFIGLSAASSDIARTIERSRFDKLREMESRHGPETKGRARGFFRRGEARQWEKMMANDDRSFIAARFHKTMDKLGYV